MKKVLLIISILFTLNSHSQVLNVSEIELNFAGDSKPQDFVKGTTKIYFSADDGVNGHELWVYDMTTNQAHMVKDINIGNDGIDNPTFLTIGDILYFAPTRNYGTQLWRSDGTEAGTYMIKQITNSSFNTISEMTAFNGSLYFIANDGTNGVELWKSDGTESGTSMLKDINTTTSVSSYPGNLTVCNGILFFTADDGINGNELWKTDGTDIGTTIIKNINGASDSSIYTTQLIALNNEVYFYAGTSANGFELWKSDGTAIGTQLFKDIVPGTGSSDSSLIGYGTSTYFVFEVYAGASGSELWKCDGTVSGTTLLKDINPGTGSSVSENTQFAALNGKIYFNAYTPANGYELWSTDGTTEGTQIVKDIFPGQAGSSISALTALNNYLMFAANDGTRSYNTVWKSDGTPAGTFELKDVNMNQNSSMNLGFAELNNKVFFPAGYNSLNGVELWSTDGTTANTSLFKDIFHKYSGITNFEDSAVLADKLIYNGNMGDGTRPFVTDGTIAGTHIISPTAPAGSSYTKAGNYVFYRSSNSINGYEIWKTDGTEANTSMVKDIRVGSGSSISEYPLFMEFNGIFYFKADDGIHGEELWRSDGTAAGTYMVKEINPGSAHAFDGMSNIYQNSLTTLNEKGYAVLNGYMYFAANDGTDSSIWRTDGTESGTTKAITVPSSGVYDNRRVVINGTQNKIFFKTNSINSSYGNNALWSSDGTQSGTSLVYQTPITGYVQYKKNIVHNNELYFNVYGNNGKAIMKSDGTVAGTSIVIENYSDLSTISSLISCGNHVYFTVGGSEFAKELWRTNGTASGTVKLGDLSTAIWENFEYCNICIEENLIFKKVSLNEDKIYYVNAGSVNADSYLTTNITNAENFGERGYSMYNQFYNLNSKLLFSAAKEYNGYELYTSNSDFDFRSLLSVDDVAAGIQNKVYIYPNPAQNSLNFKSSVNEPVQKATIYDLLGKKIISKDINNNEMDLSSIPNGIYIISITTDTAQYNSKLIIKK